MASSGTLVQPPPAPPPTADIQSLTNLSPSPLVLGQGKETQSGNGDNINTSISAQATAMVVPHRPSTQPTANSNCLLPNIDPKSEAQPSPSAITNDLLPQDLLLSLKRQQGRALNPLSPPRGATKYPPRHGKLSPQLKQQSTGTNILNRPPANVWNYPHRRTRLRHLTEAPPCVCGAGKDISFLYDSVTLEEEGERAKTSNPLPNTLVPDEYHIVKHPGVLGLEFHDE